MSFAQGSSMPRAGGICHARLKGELEQLLCPTGEHIDEDENLFDYGLDSLQIMKFLQQWRGAGVSVKFEQLVLQPTLHGWRKVIDEASRHCETVA